MIVAIVVFAARRNQFVVGRSETTSFSRVDGDFSDIKNNLESKTTLFGNQNKHAKRQILGFGSIWARQTTRTTCLCCAPSKRIKRLRRFCKTTYQNNDFSRSVL
jgi:hypothetical protein